MSSIIGPDRLHFDVPADPNGAVRQEVMSITGAFTPIFDLFYQALKTRPDQPLLFPLQSELLGHLPKFLTHSLHFLKVNFPMALDMRLLNRDFADSVQ